MGRFRERRWWWPRDMALVEDDKVAALGEEFGAGGVLLFEELITFAYGQGSEDGAATVALRTLAYRTFQEVAAVRPILERGQELGLLDDLEVNGRNARYRLVSWDRWNRQRAMARDRQQRHRNAKALQPSRKSVANVTPREREREKETTYVELGNEVRAVFDYWRQRCGHERAKLTGDRRRKIEARLRDGYTVDDLKAAVDGAAVGAFVNEQGRRFDDIELICRGGSKVEAFQARAKAGTDDKAMARRLLGG